MDIYFEIENSTSIEFLTELEKFVDIDIDNIGKDSDIIKEMKAKMRNMSIEQMEKTQLNGFTKLKKTIQDRITELKKGEI
jgi:hypothetical protein